MSKTKVNKQEKSSPQFFFKNWCHPRNWSLQTRLVYTTGVILLTGALLTLISISVTLNSSAEKSIQYKLDDYTHLIQNQLKHTLSANLNIAAGFAEMKQVKTSLIQENPANLHSTISAITSNIPKSSRHNQPEIIFFNKTGLPLFTSHSMSFPKEGSTALSYLMDQPLNEKKSFKGISFSNDTMAITSIVPVNSEGKLVGIIEASTPFDVFFSSLETSSDYGFSLLLALDQKENFISDNTFTQYDDHLIIQSFGRHCFDTPTLLEHEKGELKKCGQLHATTIDIHDCQGLVIGKLVLFYDGSQIAKGSHATIIVISCMTIVGVFLLSMSLYLNVKRIRKFFQQMKKVLIASHSNDFNEAFQIETIHCLDVLNCSHKECPVHKDPSRVCYLETGDEAISPKYRNSCIFLNKYETCSKCPVYKLHHGDELKEMRHVINTMMRLWRDFLGSVGVLLSDVFRADAAHQPSLDDVSDYLMQLASLTGYSHDIQGVYKKEEVYSQLEWIFESHFGLKTFNLMQVNASENRMESVINHEDLTESHFEVFFTCQMCRCLRVSEDVVSTPNPHICPHIGIDPATHVRCCIPMVMGGRVGAVFTFVVEKPEWEHKKKDIAIIKKYLDETAPILSSLRLLQISKEQALKDPMTQCHNRRFMDEYLAQIEKLNKRQKKTIGFIMADLDHFKMVNDEFGHLAGDEVLKQLADIIRNTIRKSDLLIRYGGEEFLIILMDIQNDTMVVEVAEKIRLAVKEAKLVLPSGGSIKKTLSMGVSAFPTDGSQIYQVIKFADVALYQAKEQGRDKVLRFAKEMWQTEEY